jgi:hypothetical protein
LLIPEPSFPSDYPALRPAGPPFIKKKNPPRVKKDALSNLRNMPKEANPKIADGEIQNDRLKINLTQPLSFYQGIIYPFERRIPPGTT